ncbi:MAG: tetratricopeptide repeat protein [Anaerolineaceae bacterium]|nr:tetratricopeptide repeat protein [Anaerolineaceae bacterium]
MHPDNFLAELLRIFSTTNSPQVIAALREDALVWESLANQELFQKAFAYVGDNAQLWTPAHLAILSLGEGLDAQDLASEPLIPLETSLRQLAIQKYQNVLKTAQPPTDLKEAGLLALALRERRRHTHSWEGLLEELSLNDESTLEQMLPVWRTPLACLFGLTPDPKDMLQALLPVRRKSSLTGLITHVVLSNPIPVEEQVQIFAELIVTQAPMYQVSWIRYLGLKGRSDLAKQLAQLFLITHQGMTGTSRNGELEKINIEEILQKAADLQRLAGLYQITDQPELALENLNASREAVEYWLAGLGLQIAEASPEDNAVLPEFSRPERWTNFSNGASQLQSEFAGVIQQKPTLSSLLPDVQEDSDDPYVMLDQAVSLNASDKLRSLDLARQAISSLKQKIGKTEKSIAMQFLYRWSPAKFIRQIIQMGLKEEALQLTQLLLQYRPVDLELIDLGNDLSIDLGRENSALEYAQIGCMLQPNEPAWHRRLGKLLEATGNFEETHRHLQAVLKLTEQPGTTDWFDFASVCMKLGQVDQVIDACEMVLDRLPEHVGANALLGDALMKNGDLNGAIRCYCQATELDPNNPGYWLALAELYQKNNDSQNSLIALKKASLENPESSEINYALAEAYLRMGMFNEAVPILRQVVLRTPNSIGVVYRLGEALYYLDRAQEGRQVLEMAKGKWPNDTELAYIYGKTLLALGEREAALPELEQALKGNNSDLERLTLYARALVNAEKVALPLQSNPDFVTLTKAQRALEKILQLKPNDFEISLMMAEVLGAKGDLEASYQAYEQLVDKPSEMAPALHWRLQAGLGQVAMNLDRIDVALAALQEAAQGTPDQLQLQKLLAEAYIKADLIQEAIPAAQYALRLAPDNLENISWFARIMTQMHRESEAVSALELALQLSPSRADLRLQLAGLQIRVGDILGARDSLNALLGLDTVTEDILRQATYAYLRLQDYVEALNCLERAVELSSAPSAELFFEMAALQWRKGDLPLALSTIQRAAGTTSQDACLYVFQADLLIALNRPQAALACLEHALHLKETKEDTGACESWAVNLAGGLMPKQWLESVQSPAGIHIRFAQILRQIGNLASALPHAETALELEPGNLPLRYYAAEMSMALLQNDRAAKLADLPGLEEGDGRIPSWEPQEQQAVASLIGMKSEIALEAGDDNMAGYWLGEGLAFSPQFPRIMAIQSRLLARKGNLKAALEVFQQINPQVLTSEKPAGTELSNWSLELDLENSFVAGQNAWLAEAALDLQLWDIALKLFEAAAPENLAEARPHLRLARALVRIAQRQRFCQELCCTGHAPGEEKLSADRFETLLKRLNLVGRLSDSREIQHWRSHGQAAFHPELANEPGSEELLASLGDPITKMAMLRHANRPADAVELAQKAGDRPQVWLQLALCYLKLDASKGLDAARKVVEICPTDPFGHVLVAMLYEACDRPEDALESLKTALTIWPDEAEWQAWAARISAQVVSLNSALEYWEKAFVLCPGRADFAQALGVTYLALQNSFKAIEYLRIANRYAPENAEIWMLLAQAYQMDGSLEEALVCGRQACTFDKNSIDPLLLSGEIAMLLGNVDEAQEHAQNAIEREPANPKAVLFLSKVFVEQGNYKDGLNVLERSLARIQPSQELLFERSQLVYRLQGPQVALPLVRELSETDPENAEVLSLLSQIQVDCGNFTGAEQSAFAALRIKPDYPGLNLLLGQLQRKSGQLDQAIHYLSEAIRQAPADVAGYLELGQSYQDRREQLQALHIYREAIKVAPEDYRAYYSGGLILRENKDYVGAEAMLRRAARLAPSDLNIQRQLGAVVALNLVHNSQEANSYL